MLIVLGLHERMILGSDTLPLGHIKSSPHELPSTILLSRSVVRILYVCTVNANGVASNSDIHVFCELKRIRDRCHGSPGNYSYQCVPKHLGDDNFYFDNLKL